MARVTAMYVGGRRNGRPHDIDDADVGTLHLIAPDPFSLDGTSDLYRTERRADGAVIHRHLRTLRRGLTLSSFTDSGEGFRWDLPIAAGHT